MIPRLQLRSPRLSHRAGAFLEPKRKSIRRGPGKKWLGKPAVIEYQDGREICNPVTDEGRAEYKWRTLLLWLRQDGWCCFHEYDFCPGRLHLWQATMEHEGKRTRARQDDRIAIYQDGRFVRFQNGAAHAECNRIAGSRMLPIFHGNNAVIELKAEV